MHEATVLADNAAVLSTQLLSIDHQFFHCLRYEELGEPTSWATFLSFLHPEQAFLEKMLSAFQSPQEKPEGPAEKNFSHPESDPYIAHFQAAVDVLNSVCDLDYSKFIAQNEHLRLRR